MKKAIAITMKKAAANHDPGASKFFGPPTVPEAWLDSFYEDEIFFCQIRLSEIAALDAENKLPHTGYLYVFLNTEDGDRHLRADVRHYDGEPDLVIDGFNGAVDGYEQFDEAWIMEFTEADEDHDGTKLFGTPSDWNYGEAPPALLLQYDPLDNETGFLDLLDGYLCLFFGDDPKDFGAATLTETYS